MIDAEGHGSGKDRIVAGEDKVVYKPGVSGLRNQRQNITGHCADRRDLVAGKRGAALRAAYCFGGRGIEYLTLENGRSIARIDAK